MSARRTQSAERDATPAPGAAADEQSLLEIARVGAPHGLRGALRVKLHNPSSDLLARLPELTLILPDGTREGRRVLSAKPTTDGHLLLAFEGCGDRSAAEALRGARVCIERRQLPRLPEGEHYFVDLIGLEARLPDGRKVGEVVDAIDYPAANVLSLRVGGGVLELPLLPPYLVEIRPEAGYVIVDQLEDLELQPAPDERVR